MFLLAKLPPSMNVAMQMIVQAKDTSEKVKIPTINEIR